MPQHSALIELLAKELGGMSLNSMAHRLHMDKAALSRLRSGERPLTHRTASKIAKELRTNESEQQELIDWLLAASPALSTEDLEVEAWFGERGQQGQLMLVEFREPPKVHSDDHLASVVANAVVAGQCYGMFLPFGDPRESETVIPGAVSAYIDRIRAAVVDTYFKFRKFIEEAADKSSSPAAIEEALGRLRLYVLTAPDGSACPSIGHRLFYVEGHALKTRECWEWISTKEKIHMLRKHSDQLELDAIAQRFYPVVEYWRAHEELPQTTAQMREYSDKLEEEQAYRRLRGLPPVPQWTVFGEPAGPSADRLKNGPGKKAERESR